MAEDEGYTPEQLRALTGYHAEQRKALSAEGQAKAAEAVGGFIGASFLLWLIFGSVFLGVFIKLSQSIPFALIIGLVFVAVMVWRGSR